MTLLSVFRMCALESSVIKLIVEKPDSKQYFSTDFCAMATRKKAYTGNISEICVSLLPIPVHLYSDTHKLKRSTERSRRSPPAYRSAIRLKIQG
ncbi:hypothetical protein HW132_31070 [Brasilonema sp. CT11]|nr:hypothetical protein [Brasilonema sp. CT11]